MIAILSSVSWEDMRIALLSIHFSTFYISLFGLGSLMRGQYPKCAYGQY